MYTRPGTSHAPRMCLFCYGRRTLWTGVSSLQGVLISKWNVVYFWRGFGGRGWVCLLFYHLRFTLFPTDSKTSNQSRPLTLSQHSTFSWMCFLQWLHFWSSGFDLYVRALYSSQSVRNEILALDILIKMNRCVMSWLWSLSGEGLYTVVLSTVAFCLKVLLWSLCFLRYPWCSIFLYFTSCPSILWNAE